MVFPRNPAVITYAERKENILKMIEEIDIVVGLVRT